MDLKQMPHAFEPLCEKTLNIPVVFNILNQENLKPVHPELEGDKIICKDIKGDRFLMKICTATEKVIFSEVIPLINQQGLPFHILQLPQLRNVVSINSQQADRIQYQDFIFMEYYGEANFNVSWHEISPFGYGGRGLDINMAEKIIGLLDDLSLIDVNLLSSFSLPTFNYTNWKNQNLPLLSEILIYRDILNQEQIDKASLVLSSESLFKCSKMIFSNGDFYPRNLIELPSGKLVIVDWEGRQDYKNEQPTTNGTQNLEDQRTAFVNYLENNLAFFFIHMWGNYAFQKRLIKAATKRFSLTSEDLQAAVLIKSLEQSIIWPDDLARRQAEIFVNALDINFINDLMR